jgi:predicted alpha/beta-fold hydrolase
MVGINKIKQLRIRKKEIQKIDLNKLQDLYKPTLYLSHPFFQSVYNITEPRHKLNYTREKIFFDDGGHVSLDWAPCLKKSGSIY